MTAQVQTTTPDILSVLSTAATNPACDPAKMKAMLDVMMEMQRERSRHEFSVAMSAAQQEMRAVAPDAYNTQTRSKYATFQRIDSALRPIYTRHGFSLSYTSGTKDAADYVPMICFVSHTGGYTREYRLDMPADGKGAKGGDVMTKTHAVGSATQYGMRYLLKMIFNVPIGDDDDGNAASGRKHAASPESVAKAREALKARGKDESKACAYLKVARLEDATEDQVLQLMATLAQPKKAAPVEQDDLDQFMARKDRA